MQASHSGSLQEQAPTCGQCEAPIQRVENAWHLDEDGRWRLTAKTVCRDGHRVLVEPF